MTNTNSLEISIHCSVCGGHVDEDGSRECECEGSETITVVSENPVARAVAAQDTRDLQHVRRVLEAELLAACASGVMGTQAHAGQLEMLQAIGEELDRRGALFPAPPFVDVCHEDGIRSSVTVRVF